MTPDETWSKWNKYNKPEDPFARYQKSITSLSQANINIQMVRTYFGVFLSLTETGNPCKTSNNLSCDFSHGMGFRTPEGRPQKIKEDTQNEYR